MFTIKTKNDTSQASYDESALDEFHELLKGEKIKGRAGMVLLPSETNPKVKRWRKVVDDENNASKPSSNASPQQGQASQTKPQQDEAIARQGGKDKDASNAKQGAFSEGTSRQQSNTQGNNLQGQTGQTAQATKEKIDESLPKTKQSLAKNAQEAKEEIAQSPLQSKEKTSQETQSRLFSLRDKGAYAARNELRNHYNMLRLVADMVVHATPAVTEGGKRRKEAYKQNNALSKEEKLVAAGYLAQYAWSFLPAKALGYSALVKGAVKLAAVSLGVSATSGVAAAIVSGVGVAASLAIGTKLVWGGISAVLKKQGEKMGYDEEVFNHITTMQHLSEENEGKLQQLRSFTGKSLSLDVSFLDGDVRLDLAVMETIQKHKYRYRELSGKEQPKYRYWYDDPATGGLRSSDGQSRGSEELHNLKDSEIAQVASLTGELMQPLLSASMQEIAESIQKGQLPENTQQAVNQEVRNMIARVQSLGVEPQKEPSSLSFGEYLQSAGNPIAPDDNPNAPISLSQIVGSYEQMIDSSIPLQAVVTNKTFGGFMENMNSLLSPPHEHTFRDEIPPFPEFEGDAFDEDTLLPPPPPPLSPSGGQVPSPSDSQGKIAVLEKQLSELLAKIQDANVNMRFGDIAAYAQEMAQKHQELAQAKAASAASSNTPPTHLSPSPSPPANLPPPSDFDDFDDFELVDESKEETTTQGEGLSLESALKEAGVDPKHPFFTVNEDKVKHCWEKYGLLLTPAKAKTYRTNANNVFSTKESSLVMTSHFEKIIKEFDRFAEVLPLRELFQDKQIKLQIVPNSFVEGKAPRGQYNSKDNTITVFDQGGGHTLLHELIHALDSHKGRESPLSEQTQSKLYKQVNTTLNGYKFTDTMTAVLDKLDPMRKADLQQRSPSVIVKTLKRMGVYDSEKEVDVFDRYLDEPCERVARSMQQFLSYGLDEDKTDYTQRAGFWGHDFMANNAKKLAGIAKELGISVPDDYVKKVQARAKAKAKGQEQAKAKEDKGQAT